MEERPYMSGEIIRRRAIEAEHQLAQSLKDHMERVVADLDSQGVAIWHANPDGSVSMIDPKDIWHHFCPYCGNEMQNADHKIQCREDYIKTTVEA